MTEMWLVRHGQTDWNLNGIYQGQSDIPLNNTGIEQARALALSLAGKHFDTIYSSDLSRALQTVKIIAAQVHAPIVTDPRLREMSHGVWEGMTFTEVKKNFATSFHHRADNLTTPHAPGGESIADVAKRMVEAANEIHSQHKDQRVLLASHGAAVAILYLVANSMPLKEIYHHIPDNGQPLVIEVNAPIQLPDFGNP